MKKLVVLIVITFYSLAAKAQADSILLKPDPVEYEFLYRELFNFSTESTFGPVVPDRPAFNFKLNWANPFETQTTYNFSNFYQSRFNGAWYPNPFVSAYFVNSSAEYRLSERWKMGGNSFSANSIYDPVPLNFDPSKMNIRGINFYMEYKVSDKFRIGGGVQINQGY
ncbi:hypothetical protein [Mangrovibacterium diazotrophicum]|uniref:Outer membrane protein with beta-barrel domain n=1 Tax=Mangrovibacterium diazotrophicum TaxID=1261403 RepID=A0A419W3N7_9BACT|nr:hypothetical protein [Mangrovibacterium diazotrophicum]RKD90088.1 hypothetical protein BC643_0424 [Mangrovibacterium diazotrophicum]